MKRLFNKLTSPSLRNDTLFYGFAVLAERVVSLLIISLLTKTLSQELYGIWTQIVVTTGLLSPVVLVGFYSAAVRFLAGEKDRQKISSTFHGMFGITLFNSFMVIMTTFLFTLSLSKLMFGDIRFSKFIYLFGLFLMTEVIFELNISYLRAQGEIKILSIYYFLKNVGRLAILAFGILLFKSDFFYTIMIIVVTQLLLIIWIYLKHILLKVGISLGNQNVQWKNIIYFSLPIVPYSLLIWGNNFVDRYLILHVLDIKKVSIYAVAYSLAAIIGLFYSILGFTLYPHISKLWNEGNKKGTMEMVQKGLGYYLFFAIPSIAVLTILSDTLIRMFSTSEYLSSWQVVFWLGMGVGTFGLYQITCYLLWLLDKTILNLKISAVALVTNVLINMILIPKMGILGASVATFLSNIVLAFWTTAVGKKYFPYVFPWRATAKIVLATLMMSIFLLIILYYIEVNNLYKLLSAIIIAFSIYGSIDLLGKNSFLLQLVKTL